MRTVTGLSTGDFENGIASACLNGKYGYIDRNGNLTIAPQFEEARNFCGNGLARARMSGKWGFIDRSGKYVINPLFDWTSLLCDDGFAVVMQNDRFGIINNGGEVVVTPQFARIIYDASAGWSCN